jgi:CheY-like chemotaxis protein
MPIKKVLIVEDHQDNADAIAQFLRFVFPDWTIDQTSKGLEAVEQMVKEPADVLILDIALADSVNGLDVIKRLWQEGMREKPKVIITTAMGNKAFRGPRVGRPWVEQLNEHERTLVVGFFEKPFGWHTFLTAIAKAAGVEPPEKLNLIPENE